MKYIIHVFLFFLLCSFSFDMKNFDMKNEEYPYDIELESEEFRKEILKAYIKELNRAYLHKCGPVRYEVYIPYLEEKIEWLKSFDENFSKRNSLEF